MKRDDQLLALCDVLGWGRPHLPATLCSWIAEDGTQMLSDPTTDMNAARQAWADAMASDIGFDDEYFLLILCGKNNGYAHKATPAQWVEAILRTLGKWES
jgi:hypothetical protein